MVRVIVLLLVFALMSAGVTYVAYLFSKNTRVVKYLPSFASILMAAYIMFLPMSNYQGMQDIGRVVTAIAFIAWAVGGIICAVVIDARIKNSGK